jgi:hypothetical protein
MKQASLYSATDHAGGKRRAGKETCTQLALLILGTGLLDCSCFLPETKAARLAAFFLHQASSGFFRTPFNLSCRQQNKGPARCDLAQQSMLLVLRLTRAAGSGEQPRLSCPLKSRVRSAIGKPITFVSNRKVLLAPLATTGGRTRWGTTS